MLRRRVPQTLLLALTALALLAPSAAHAADRPGDVPHVEYPGMQRILYKFGPIDVRPGQNDIRINPTNQMPDVPGYITRFKPDLVRVEDGTVPGVDVLHLHHAVWLAPRQIDGSPIFAAGEEKTILQAPRGFGWRYQPGDRWSINDMIHNLVTNPDRVYITYEIDFVPDSSPAAAQITPVRTKWLDVAGMRAYPVFDARRAWDKGDDKYTFPQEAPPVEQGKIGRARQWTVPRDMTLIGTAGHLHPGGLYTDLYVTRNGLRKRIFRSRAKYFEPAGAVSWDVSMMATPDEWRVKVKRGDLVSIDATYDTSRASWYEAMGIMPVAVANGHGHGGYDPFDPALPKKGEITHGPLPENQNKGGDLVTLPNAARMLGKPVRGIINIDDYFYARGDLNRGTRLPTVKVGGSLTFRNLDAARPDPDVQHTITACRAPCNRRTGVAYPLANGQVDFDSGTLGFGPPGFTAAVNRDTWSTPRNLREGTYTYFCRIHPFMRGAFRVEK